jgi:hypothetical protein
MQVNGRCHCRSITYSAVVDAEKVALCHCTDCQMLTGSAFRVSVPVARESFVLLSGEPRRYVKTAQSGAKRVHAFCPHRGTPVYSCALNDPPTFSLRIGGLEQRALLAPKKQIWCCSALDWATDVARVTRVDRQ